jgi:hypothetical protein
VTYSIWAMLQGTLLARPWHSPCKRHGRRQTDTDTDVGLSYLVALQSHAGTGTARGHAAHTRRLGKRPYATESAVPECVDLS